MKRSQLEKDMGDQLASAGLTEGMVEEFRFHPERRWRFDFAWPERTLATEVQAAVFSRGRHSLPRGLPADWETASEAPLLGLRTVIVSRLEIRNGQALDRAARLLS